MTEPHDKKLPKGFTCEDCGKKHRFPSYVYAHWDEELFTTCDCGTRYCVFRGHASKEPAASLAAPQQEKA